MGQCSTLARNISFLLCGLVLSAGCSDRAGKPTATRPAGVTVASTVPAATDLILGMGAGEHLVAVSKYDKDRPDVSGLPLVGDYLSTDWEMLARVRPDVLVVQIAPDRMPAGLKQRAEQLGIRLLNVQINRLTDVFTALDQLGAALKEEGKAQRMNQGLHQRLETVRARVGSLARARVLLTTDEKAENVVGRDNFLNDLLELAGGENVIGPEMGSWPKIDREMLVELRPEVVLQLLSQDNEDAAGQAELQKRREASQAEARRVWQTLPQVPAVKQERVYQLSDWYLLLPGSHVADVAEKFAEYLHPMKDEGKRGKEGDKRTSDGAAEQRSDGGCGGCGDVAGFSLSGPLPFSLSCSTTGAA